MKKREKNQVQELSTLFVVSFKILRNRLMLSNDALQMIFILGIAEPEKASLLLASWKKDKKGKNRVWINDMKDKFKRLHRLMFEFFELEQESNEQLNNSAISKVNSKLVRKLIKYCEILPN